MREVLGDVVLGDTLFVVVTAAVAVAGLVGAAVAIVRISRRRRPSRPSVYDVIRRRLEADPRVSERRR